jgi:hypothetical protein
MATGFPTKANWAAGDILTAAQMDDLAGTVNFLSPVGQTNGSTLVANSSASSGLSWITPVGSLANPIINGGFDIAQRGTSVAVGAAFAYTLDRWKAFRGGVVAGMTVSRQATGDTTNLPNIQYCARVQRDSGNTSTADLAFETGVETTNSIPFAGKAVTVSFYARKGANYSSASNALSVSLYSGTGTDQTPDVYTGSTNVGSVTATLTSTWQRFSFNATVGTTATEIGIFADYVPVGTAGAADYYEMTGVQIDLGTYSTASVPTFRRTGTTLQGELAACQRYCVTTPSIGFSSGTNIATGNYYSSTVLYALLPLPVEMRTAPTCTFTTAGNYSVYCAGSGATTVTAIGNDTPTQTKAVSITATTAANTIGRGGWLSAANTNGYIIISAEL